MNAIRAFIAIELPESFRVALNNVMNRLRGGIPTGVRWVPAGNIHLTLQFLGETSPANLAMLSKSLPAVALRQRPFEFEIGGLGAFPNMRRPRVIWVGIQAPPALAELTRAIEVETSHLGYQIDGRAFSPHLTLGRVNQSASPRDVAEISNVLTQSAVQSLGKIQVESINIYRSDLNPNGSVYTTLATFPLGR